MGIARLYKAGTPYNAVDLSGLDNAQTADVVYLAHLNYPPEKLVRGGHTDWTFSEIAFAPTMDAPGGVTATPTIANNDATLSNGDANANPNYYPSEKTYAVSSVNAAGQESRLSAGDGATNDLSLKGNYNTVTWTADPDAEYYNIYAIDNGSLSYGYVGRAETNSFIDNNGGVAPDYADGPRLGQNPFVGAGNYPSAVNLHEQALYWARSRDKPNGIWRSRVADFENMDTSRPTKDDDAMTFAIVSDRVNSISHLASLKSLLALTSDGIFTLDGAGDGSPITASQVRSKRDVGIGSSRLAPLVADTAVLFVPNQGTSVRALGFSFQIDGFQSNDVSIFSPHFFEGYQITAWAHQREPFSIIWLVRNDGKLLALTWEQEQSVWGWTLCETSGTVEDVAVITEDGVDRVYLAVRRTLAGAENVFIERMALPLLVESDLNNACYLDCAVTQQTDEPTDTASGLWHLEGETVTAFADGYVVEDLIVANGRVTLAFAASTITVGLPYSGEFETLPFALVGVQGTSHVDRQMIENVTIRVEKMRGLKVGAGGSDLFEIKQREFEELDEPIALATKDYQPKIGSKWNDGATVRVVQDYPLPATVTAIFAKPKVTK